MQDKMITPDKLRMVKISINANLYDNCLTETAITENDTKVPHIQKMTGRMGGERRCDDIRDSNALAGIKTQRHRQARSGFNQHHPSLNFTGLGITEPIILGPYWNTMTRKDSPQSLGRHALLINPENKAPQTINVLASIALNLNMNF